MCPTLIQKTHNEVLGNGILNQEILRTDTGKKFKGRKLGAGGNLSKIGDVRSWWGLLGCTSVQKHSVKKSFLAGENMSRNKLNFNIRIRPLVINVSGTHLLLFQLYWCAKLYKCNWKKEFHSFMSMYLLAQKIIYVGNNDLWVSLQFKERESNH